jgi:hypothetical protein
MYRSSSILLTPKIKRGRELILHGLCLQCIPHYTNKKAVGSEPHGLRQ